MPIVVVQEARRITLLPIRGRRYLWRWCETLGLNKHGLPGQACNLLERFLSPILRKLSTTSDQETIDECRGIIEKTRLITGCCIQLAWKMYKRANNKSTEKNIFWNDYTKKDIVKMEATVFQGLGFYVPSITTVEIAELLAVEIRVNDAVFKEIDHFVSQAEMFKPAIIEKVQWAADHHGPEPAVICRLHLAAGGVAAAVHYVGFCDDPAIPLGHLTSAPPLYITTIARALLVQLDQ